MNTKLHEEEKIVESFPASLLTSGTPGAGTMVSGTIFLTNLRFIYEPLERKPNNPDFLARYYIDIAENDGNVYGENIGWVTPGTLYCMGHSFLLFRGEKITNGEKIADRINKKFLTESSFVNQRKIIKKRMKKIAIEREKHLDYEEAIEIYEKYYMPEEAARVRKLKADLAAPKTEIHGDYVDDRDTTYVDDRDTIIKDSVVSKSSIGAGGDGDDLAAKLQQLAQMHRDGILSDEQFEAAKNKMLN